MTTDKRFSGAMQCGEPVFVVDMSKKHGDHAYRVYPFNIEAAEVHSECMERLSGEFVEEQGSGAV